MAELTVKQKWSQLGLGLAIGLAASFALFLIGAKAPWAAIPAIGMWTTPWIEWKTTGRQPRNLTASQCVAIGLTIGYLVFEMSRW
jgi:hypothetical protein